MRPGLRGEVGRGERAPSGEEPVGDDTERVDVAGRGGWLAADLLRRDVRGGAEDLAGRGDRVLQGEARDAEVRDREARAAVEEQVRGLDVPVHHAGGVSCVQRARGLAQPFERAGHRRGEPPGHGVGDRPSLEVLHHDVGAPVVLADVVYRHDVRMRGQHRRSACLADKALDRGRVVDELRREELHGHAAPQRPVLRDPDRGHAAVRHVVERDVAVGKGEAGPGDGHAQTAPYVGAVSRGYPGRRTGNGR